MRKILIFCLSLLALVESKATIYTFGPNNPNAAYASITNVAYATNAGYAETAGDASFAIDANLAVNAVGSSFATNALTFNVSNALHLGITYPTVVTSGSAGLVIDQPLTVGGTTPGVTFGSGGRSITGTSTTLNIYTNIIIDTNQLTLTMGNVRALNITNVGGYSRVSINTPAGTIIPNVVLYAHGQVQALSGFYSSSGEISVGTGYFFSAVNRARLYPLDVNLWAFRDAGGSAGCTITSSNLLTGAIAATNTITASNIVATTTVTATNFSFILTNGTGSNSVAGMLVEMHPNSNFCFKACAVNSQTPIGVVVDDGIANGSPVRIADRGIIQVLTDSATTTNWSGSWFGSSATTAGRAVILTDPPSAAVHDREIGHGLKIQALAASDSITNLTWVLLHIGR